MSFNENTPPALDSISGVAEQSDHKTVQLHSTPALPNPQLPSHFGYNNASHGFYLAEDFLDLSLPLREVLMPPWLDAASITMIHAKAGVGKSNYALALAVALALGIPFLGETPSEPRRVMYVDGEMPQQELQRRLKSLTGGLSYEGRLAIHSAAMAEKGFGVPPLNTQEGQDALMRMFDSFLPDVLILDNKSTLFSNIGENDAGSWESSQTWLMRLRAENVAIIILHHSGKNGQQRGSAIHEVAADIIIGLYEPKIAPPETGSHFELRFEKTRHLHAGQLTNQIVSLNMLDDQAEWKWRPYKSEKINKARVPDPRKASVIALKQEGKTVRYIHQITGVSIGTISDWTSDKDGRSSA